MPYDVIIPYHKKDSKVIQECIRSCKKYIKEIRNIYIITNDQFSFHEEQGVFLTSQDKFFGSKPTISYIKNYWDEENKLLSYRAGWIFQQFIKMGASYSIEGITDNYFVVDADVILLRPIEFLKNNGQTLMLEGEKVHEPYLTCYKKLVDLDPCFPPKSFVNPVVLLNKNIMTELLDHIEKLHDMPWYDAILKNMDLYELSPFSEFQTYGEYVFNKYPDFYIFKKGDLINLNKYCTDISEFEGKADFLLISDYLVKKNKKKRLKQFFNTRFWLKRIFGEGYKSLFIKFK